MKTTIAIQIRTFPITVQDLRTGRVMNDCITLTKEQLQAAQLVGQSSKELITRIAGRQGYRLMDVGKADKREIALDLGRLADAQGGALAAAMVVIDRDAAEDAAAAQGLAMGAVMELAGVSAPDTAQRTAMPFESVRRVASVLGVPVARLLVKEVG